MVVGGVEKPLISRNISLYLQEGKDKGQKVFHQEMSINIVNNNLSPEKKRKKFIFIFARCVKFHAIYLFRNIS
jgi:hypothetical protein